MTATTGVRARRLTRGVVSKLTGCNIETLRYYERAGLMPDPARSEGGHRIYTDDQVRRLMFIRRCRQLGFTVEQIRELLRLVDGGDYTCAEVRVITVDHLDDVGRKIADLRKIQTTLRDMAAECDGGDVPECPIVDVLFKDPGRPAR
jgi:MerR family mercuric resistance operon transcriptional regulator